MKTKNLLYFLPLLALVACEPEFDDMNYSGGSADFSRMVAVGNSLTAGYQSNALSKSGQINSIPNILAEQLKNAGGGAFKQPLLTGKAGEIGAGTDLILQGKVVPALSLTMSTDCKGKTSLGPKVIKAPYLYDGTNGFKGSVAAAGPYNNVGVPGAKLTHLNFAGYAAANPYFARFTTSPSQTVIENAMMSNHTFFTLWIGNNDVLTYALSGGDEGGDNITSAGVFTALYKQTLDSLTKNGQKGVLANIPNITDIPFFTTIPYKGAVVERQQDLDALNAAYGPYNAGLDQVVQQNPAFETEANLRKINFQLGANAFIILDNTLTDLSGNGLPSIRQIKAGELITLRTPQDSLKCAGWGTSKPIPGNYTLIKSEVDDIVNAVGAYNNIIKTEAQSRGLAFVDANKRLRELKKGIVISGISFNSEMVTGGAFSLDGVHPSNRGYAVLANDFIDAINSTYGAAVPKVNVASYSNIEVE